MKKLLLASAVILSFPTLNACVPAAIGGAAAGGYYIAKEDRPAGQVAEDAGITAKVKGAFIKDKEVVALDINVDTYYNVVTLYGSVPSDAVAEKAIRIARKADKVRGVVSKLTVVHPR